MKAPRYRIHGWSWLGVVNFVLVQRFFVRLEATVDTPVVAGKSQNEPALAHQHCVPLTGSWTPYRYWP
jgi:hypothetical protein